MKCEWPWKKNRNRLTKNVCRERGTRREPTLLPKDYCGGVVNQGCIWIKTQFMKVTISLYYSSHLECIHIIRLAGIYTWSCFVVNVVVPCVCEVTVGCKDFSSSGNRRRPVSKRLGFALTSFTLLASTTPSHPSSKMSALRFLQTTARRAPRVAVLGRRGYAEVSDKIKLSLVLPHHVGFHVSVHPIVLNWPEWSMFRLCILQQMLCKSTLRRQLVTWVSSRTTSLQSNLCDQAW